jgi:hypothetical protein
MTSPKTRTRARVNLGKQLVIRAFSLVLGQRRHFYKYSPKAAVLSSQALDIDCTSSFVYPVLAH